VAPGEELPRGEFYWHEVIGAKVSDVDGSPLGEVVDMYRAGGAEVMVVRGTGGEIDVPLVRAVVRIFAPSRGEIVVDGDALGLHGDDGGGENEEITASPPAAPSEVVESRGETEVAQPNEDR